MQLVKKLVAAWAARIGPTLNLPKAGLGQIDPTEAMRIYNEDFRRRGISCYFRVCYGCYGIPP